MRIVQLANFHSPGSGGLRIAVDRFRAGYLAAGHDAVLVVPGTHDHVCRDVVTIWGPSVPGTPYRLLVRRIPVLEAIDRFGPDRIEVSDKTTLRWVGDRARGLGVPSVLYSHERIDAVLQRLAPRLPRRDAIAARWTARWAESFDAVVCGSEFAADEFQRLGHRPAIVRLGVDTAVFTPAADRRPGPLRLAWVGRMSPEKLPALAVDTCRAVARRRPVSMRMIGDGPMRPHLERRAADLPVEFTGRVDDRAELAALVADADISLATGPAETFGLAALESLACGVPVVCPEEGSTRELLDGPATGLAVRPDPWSYAAAVEAMAELPWTARRDDARRAASAHRWDTAVASMLAVHAGLGAG